MTPIKFIFPLVGLFFLSTAMAQEMLEPANIKINVTEEYLGHKVNGYVYEYDNLIRVIYLADVPICQISSLPKAKLTAEIIKTKAWKNINENFLEQKKMLEREIALAKDQKVKIYLDKNNCSITRKGSVVSAASTKKLEARIKELEAALDECQRSNKDVSINQIRDFKKIENRLDSLIKSQTVPKAKSE